MLMVLRAVPDANRYEGCNSRGLMGKKIRPTKSTRAAVTATAGKAERAEGGPNVGTYLRSS